MNPEFLRSIHNTVERLGKRLTGAEVETQLGFRSEALTRFANNTIHQNVAEESRWLSVRIQVDHRTARASSNSFDDDSIARTVGQAIALTNAAEPDPDLLPMVASETIRPVARFHEHTANVTPAQRAAGVTDAIRLIESSGQTAAGIYSTEHDVHALFNSRGVAAYYNETLARFSITALAENSSGWAKASSTDAGQILPAELARVALDKSRFSKAPRELPAGKYTVILEPAAVLDLVGQMFFDFSATAINDQRSFLTDRLGERLFGENITIRDDVYHGLQAGPSFDGEGVPRKVLMLVDRGTPREIAYSRSSAHKAGVSPTGHGFPLPNEAGEMPSNIVIEGGTSSVEDMIASTERGILVTRLWYIREVDPYEKIMTGMTRDGTFLIENGKFAGGLKNFRFNQSLIELLSNVESLSPAVRASGEEAFDMVVPAMKVNGFNFTEVTRF